MALHRLIEDFADGARKCTTGSDLYGLTEAAAREIGFPKFALVHGLWFRQPDRRLIRLDNFGDWADIFIERKYYRDDPALLACQRTNTAFPWTQLSELIPFGRRQIAILSEAQHHGLCTGFTLPVGVIGEPHGCCSFSCDKSDLPSRWHLRAATLIAADAFHEARRLHGLPARARRVPQLSRRKLECLRYLAIGKTDGEIATILGLREPTVRTYMTLLRKDFNVVSRSQLTAAPRALGCSLRATTKRESSMITITHGYTLADTATAAMFADRKRLFVDLLGWDVPVSEGRYEIDRLGRDALDVQAMVRRLLEEGITLDVCGLGVIGRGVGELIVAVLAQMTDMERHRIRQRCESGCVAARALDATGLTHRGKASLGRPKAARPSEVVAWRKTGNASIKQTAEHFGIGKATVTRYGAAANTLES